MTIPEFIAMAIVAFLGGFAIGVWFGIIIEVFSTKEKTK